MAVREKLWDFATEEHQKQDELKIICTGQKQVYKHCLSPSCRTGSLDMLETLWSWAKEVELNRG
jgi:hypothetical protein